MITNRFITLQDYYLIEDSLRFDNYHKGTLPEFFYEDGTVCSVYSDEDGPICFVRGKPIINENIKIIQLDIQYLDNSDAKRNIKAMLEGFPELEQKAKENGFAGFFFVSDTPLLRKFCVRRLGFMEYGPDYLVKSLIDKEQEVKV